MSAKIELVFLLLLFSSVVAQAGDSSNNPHPEARGKVILKGKLIYSEIRISASTQVVWDILMDFAAYPQWNPFIKEIAGDSTVGNRIRAHIVPPGQKGMVFTPLVLVNEPGHEFRWIGKLGISHLFDGEHTFTLTDNGDGTCTFRQYEHFRGILVPLFAKMLNMNTQQGFELMNQKLKEKAERELRVKNEE